MTFALHIIALAADIPPPATSRAEESSDSEGVRIAAALAATTEDISLLMATLNGDRKGNRTPIHDLMDRLEQRLRDRSTASATAHVILDRRREYDLGPVVDRRLEALTREGKGNIAAELWLQCLRAHLVSNTLKSGGMAIGRVVVEDGKLDPEMVLCQMPILEDGYFATEIGSLSRPIRFRAAGYDEVEVPLTGKPGPVIDVGMVLLRPLPKEKEATLKAQLALDIPERGPATVRLSLNVPRGNMPYFGVSPRRRWPDPMVLKVERDGVLYAESMTPGEYHLQINAKDHATYTRVIRLSPGKELDRGTIKLHTKDFGHFLGRPPQLGELFWQKELTPALRRATSEQRPVLLMMVDRNSPQWLALEKEVLSDPWVKYILSSFVLVKTLEDKQVEAVYQAHVYPTMVFMDASGREVHRTTGLQPAAVFLGHCVKAFRALDVPIPEKLQVLIDRKVVADH